MSENEAEITAAAGNWLECLPWNGQEASLPAGGNVQVKGLSFTKLIYRVEVLDAESEEGSRFVKVSEVTPDDVIIGAKLNENSIKRIEANYGKDWIRIANPNGGGQMSREAWKERFGTDGLQLLAVRELRKPGSVAQVGQSVTQMPATPKPQVTMKRLGR